MVISILHFSGTGNTYFVAKLIGNYLSNNGFDSKLYPIEKIKNVNELVDNSDIFGIGFPIYGSDMPDIVKNMIEDLLPGKGKRVFVFCTQMMYSGDGGANAARKLIEKGFLVKQIEHFNMPNNLRDFAKFLPTKVNYEKLEKKTRKKAEKFAEKVIFNKRKLKGMNFVSNILGLLQRKPYQKLKSRTEIRMLIEDNCILCKKCLELCPVNNYYIEDNRLKSKTDCILCYRCINHCPTKSLHINKRNTVSVPYLGPTKDFKIKDVMN
jgi:flavodoxin/Pyruvate/2-oxoacid:ferredoxin oxidoreductase delta subunit